MDFGCYGANLIAWLMRDQTPVSVSATFQNLKRDPLYAKVDDEATIVVAYPQTQGIIQASWNWPYHRKDLEVYGEQAAFFSVGRESISSSRLRGDRETHHAGRPAAADDGISYGPALDNVRALLAGREDVPSPRVDGRQPAGRRDPGVGASIGPGATRGGVATGCALTDAPGPAVAQRLRQWPYGLKAPPRP